jgi:glycosyltransferase involved in cell wall biosynthesis
LKVTRVLHLIPSLSGGGAERQLQLLAGGLAGYGLDVHVAAHYEGPQPPDHLRPAVAVHLLRRPHRHPLLPLELATLIRRIRPDLIHTWLAGMDLLGGALAGLTDRPWIMAERSSPLAYPATAKYRMRRQMARLADTIVANSNTGASYWRGHPNVRIIPNAVDVAAIAATAPLTGPIEPFVLFVGRLEDWSKNVDTLTRAFDLVLRQSLLNVVFCGDGPDRHMVEATLGPHIAAGRVTLTGYTSEVWSYMKSAAAFVSVSRFEGSPNTVLEAIACGCPLVLSDIPEHREIGDADTAWFVPTEDASAQAAAILEAAHETERARAKVDRARSALAERAPARIAAQYRELYDEVLISRRRVGEAAPIAAPLAGHGRGISP